MTIEVRQARPPDAVGIRDVFRAGYGDDYLYPGVYDLAVLMGWIRGDEVLVFVAARPGGTVLGTAMLDLRPGDARDRRGEFGRLCVRPDACGRGLGTRLMEARLAAAEGRLLVGVSEARAAAPASAAIGLRHGFRPVGFFPSKDRFGERESSVLMVRHFGGALERRAETARLVPEVAPVARQALRSLGLPGRVRVVDPPPYPGGGPAPEVVSVGRREGIEALAARRAGRVEGRLSWRWSRRHRQALLRGLEGGDAAARRALLTAMAGRAERLGALYLEAEVNAADPGAQRALVDLGFRAGGYLPAGAVGPAGRIDRIRMIRVCPSADPGPLDLHPEVRPWAALVLGREPVRTRHQRRPGGEEPGARAGSAPGVPRIRRSISPETASSQPPPNSAKVTALPPGSITPTSVAP